MLYLTTPLKVCLYPLARSNRCISGIAYGDIATLNFLFSQHPEIRGLFDFVNQYWFIKKMSFRKILRPATFVAWKQSTFIPP